MKKVENKLKSILKRKVSISEALMVSFLITGGLSYSSESVKLLEIEPIKKADNIIEQRNEVVEIQIKKNKTGFIAIKDSADGKYKSKLEILGEPTEINKVKADKVSDHILEKKPKYLSVETISIEEKNKIKKEISGKIKKDESKVRLEEEVAKYCKENSLLEQKLFNGNGETVREYLKETEVKEFFIIENNNLKIAIIPATLALTAGALIKNSSSGGGGSSSGGDDSSNDEESSIDEEFSIDEEKLSNSQVWLDGVVQNTKIYTNPVGTTIATTENNHGLRSSGADTEITNAGAIVLNNSSVITTTTPANQEIINYDTGEIQKGAYAGHVFGMVGDYGATVKNTGTISLTKVGQGGIFVTNGSNALNEGSIDGVGSVGIYGESGSTIVNKGIISNTGNYGVYGTGSGTTVTNEVGGIVSNDGDNGIYVESGSTAINKGTISNTGVYGMYGIGLGTTVTNEIGGIVSNDGDNGIYVESGSTAINKGTVSNTGNYGMYGTGLGTTVTNEVGGIVSNDGDNGIYVESGSTAINKGTVSNTAGHGMYGTGLGTTVTNEVGGTISNKGTNNSPNSGIHVESGSTAINKGTISIIVSDYGMYGAGSGTTVTNEIGGTISSSGSGYITDGIHVEKGSTAINKGTISNRGVAGIFATDLGTTATNEVGGTISTKAIGIIAEYGATVINKGTVSSIAADGVYVTDLGSTVINKGTISNTGGNGMYVTSLGATAINEVGGIISNSGDNGMIAVNRGSAVNKGTISNGGNYGMYAMAGGTALNDTTGVINQQGGPVSMYATGAGSTVQNKGTVSGTIEAVNQGTVLMSSQTPSALTHSTSNNDCTVKTDGAGSTSINTGILIANTEKPAMLATNNATSVNKGTINITGESALGMEATNGGTIVNEGKINVNADNGRAMSVSTNSTLINEGDINLNSTNGVGIYATGTGATVHNNGSIYIAGEEVPTSGAGATAKDANGNQAMYIGEGATFVNNGQFTVDGDLDSNSMGTGTFVVAGGTVEAKTIRGDYYASGALTMGSYENEYTTYQMFKADNMYADIYSNSAMFDAKLAEADSNGFYGVDMYRKDFNDIVYNSEYGAYLENNYTTTNNSKAKENLYDAYKLVVSQDTLNKEIDETFGNTIYPTFMYQTLSMIRSNNQKLKSEVFTPTEEEVRYIGYANYSDSDVKMDGNVSDYDAKLLSVSLGIDEKISKAMRVGAVVTVGKGDYNYNGSSDKREDDFYQLNLVGSYEKDGVKGTATAYFGRTSGDLDRTLAVTSVHEEMKGDLDNEYYGIDLSLEKKYELEKFNLTPKIELNTVFVKQDSVDEKGVYALDVETINSSSVEGGIGFKIDKEFRFANKGKITPQLTAMYYREFSNPYENTSATLTSVSSDKVTIDGYNSERDRGVFGVAATFEKNNLGLTVGVDYKVDDQSSEVTPYASVGYKF